MYLSTVTLIHSVFKVGKNSYTLVILEECKYIVKEKEVSRYIAEDLQISSNSDGTDEE